MRGTGEVTTRGQITCDSHRLILSCGAPAQAAPTQVNVRIEGRSKTLFEGPILTEGHDVSSYEATAGAKTCRTLLRRDQSQDPENTTSRRDTDGGAVDAMNLIGETDAIAGQWYGSFEDYYVKQWGTEEENAETGSRYWGVLVNNVFTDVGGCQYELRGGDEVLWIYNAFESRPILGLFAAGEHYSSGVRPLTATAQWQALRGRSRCLRRSRGRQPPATPERTRRHVALRRRRGRAGRRPPTGIRDGRGSTSSEAVTTNSEGKASITFTTPGWHRIMAGARSNAKGEEAAIRSNRLDVCVPARQGRAAAGRRPPKTRFAPRPDTATKSTT